MASLGHVIVGLAAGRWLAGEGSSSRALALAMAGMVALSLAPDLDVVAFRLGIPYEAPFGHRGASHSLAAAAAVGALVGLWRARVGVMAGLVVASHGLLDALTDGGHGVALLWPWEEARIFAPWRPLPVAPIGRGMVSARGLTVMATEALWFAPLAIYALWPRRRRAGGGAGAGAR